MLEKNTTLVRKVTKSFDLKRGIDLPSKIAQFQANDFFLFTAVDKASFISTNVYGKEFLELFKKGHSIEEVINIMKEKGIATDKIISELHSFLVKVEKKGFYEDATVKEPPIEPILHVDITNKCNLTCVHCFQDAGKPRENELSTSEWLKVIEDFSNLYKTNITISGGEPLCHPGIFEILEKSKNSGLYVTLFTNGTLINDEQIVEKFEKYVDKIQISLDGATEKENDEIRGKGSFEKIIYAFQLLQKTKIHLNMAVSLMPQNLSGFTANVERMINRIGLGVDIRISPIMKEGRAQNSHMFSDKNIAKFEVRKMLEELFRKRLKTIQKEEKNVRINNCGYAESVVVSSIGDVYPCNVYESRVKIGNIRTGNFSDMVKEIDKLRQRVSVENIAQCSVCDLKMLCFGGCRLNNVYRNNDILIPCCTEEYKKEICEFVVEKEENFHPLELLMDNKST
jgi:radical SAM protein with 4Fe4S-binding SPASM domain